MQEGRDYLKKSVSSWLPSLQKKEESLVSAAHDMEEEEENPTTVRIQVFVFQRQQRDKDRMHHDLSFDLFLIARQEIALHLKKVLVWER